MEARNSDNEAGDSCNVNGNCSPLLKSRPFDMNNSKNIDDIATPSDLKFDEDFDADNIDDPELISKIKEIEKCLEDLDNVGIEKLKELADSKGGFIADRYRRRLWPALLRVSPAELTEPPSLAELAAHPEYNQVVLDVNRSLKRFPPGIPLPRRLALQEQLTALILRVMRARPELHYYQGYHDVAITLLLVCGARAAFPLLLRLSAGPAAPLAAYMARDLQPAQRRLNHLLPALRRARPPLAAALAAAGVGTMFALPWCLTWFGHSLPRYADVVRLYDCFLTAHPLFAVYVTAAVLMHREREILECECDMAAMHCLLSRLPEELPFEEILGRARRLQAEHPPASLRAGAEAVEREEEAARAAEEARRLRARVSRARLARRAALAARWRAARPLLLAAAAALLGVYMYYRPELPA